MSNKAHAATLRRIKDRYGGDSGHADGVDIVSGELRIEVETTATLAEGIARLSALSGLRFIAVTNKEAIGEALRLAAGTGIGVMDSHGEVLHAADGNSAPTDNDEKPSSGAN